MPPALFTDDLSFGGNTSGLLDTSQEPVFPSSTAFSSAAQPPTSPAKAPLTKAVKSRPSWGPPPTAVHQQDIRLLDGLPSLPQWPLQDVQDQAPDASTSQNSSQNTGSNTGAGKVRLGGIERGKGKPRFSLFPRALPPPDKRPVNEVASTSSSGPAPPPVVKSAVPALPDETPALGVSSSDENLDGTSTPVPESDAPLPTREDYIHEIGQLRALNNVFTNYDVMLQGAGEHIDVVASRVRDINQLLDIYIDLLRRSQQIHSVLVDPSWQGISEEGRLHEEAVTAAAEAAAKRQAEAEAKEQQEEAQRAAAQEAVRMRSEATASSSRLGLRRTTSRGSGGRAPLQRTTSHTRPTSVSGPTRASSLRSASARAGAPPARSAGAASSSSSRPGSRSSGIPRPSIAGGRYGNGPSTGYGRR